MNDNQKTTKSFDESKGTGNVHDFQAHQHKEQLSTGTTEGKTVQTSALHKKLKKNNRPRPLL